MQYYSSVLHMDILSISPLPGLLLCTSLTLIFLLFFFLILHKHKFNRPNLPPGKTGWPIIGETLQLLLLGRKGCPEKFLHERRNNYSSDVFRTSLFGENMVFFCGQAANKFLFSNDSKLVTRWWPNTGKLFISDNSATDETSTIRSLLSGFLKMDVMKNYIAKMDCIAKEHIQNNEWEAKGGEVVVHEAVKKYTFDLACQLLMGVQDKQHLAGFSDRFAAVFDGILSLPIDFPGTRYNRAIKNMKFLRKEIAAIIKEKKTRLEKAENLSFKDLMTYLLVTPSENGKFVSEEEIAHKIIGLLIAGHDPASTAITFTIKYLAELPHVYQEVFKEVMEIAKAKGSGELLNWGDIQKMRYTWNVVCEAMRLVPPSQMFFKKALTDFSFAGFTIPKGWKICWGVHSTHKDPTYFPNPEKFDATRFDGIGPPPCTYVPFGGGPRMCPGKEYSRLEILVFIYNLVKKFHWKKLILNERILFKLTPYPENGLPVRLMPHETTSTE